MGGANMYIGLDLTVLPSWCQILGHAHTFNAEIQLPIKLPSTFTVWLYKLKSHSHHCKNGLRLKMYSFDKLTYFMTSYV